MKKTLLIFGVLAGIIVSVLMSINMFVIDEEINRQYGVVLGYSSMIIAFTTIFLGIRSYREKYGNGSISFGKAFRIGLVITLIASAFYVGGWLIYHYSTGGEWMQQYAANEITSIRESDLSDEKKEARIAKVETMMQWMENPIMHGAVVFTEIFPVGLLVSVIAALVMKRKPRLQAVG